MFFFFNSCNIKPYKNLQIWEHLELPWWFSWWRIHLQSRSPRFDPGWKDLLEEGMATHSSILAWRIPWTEEPGGLQSIGSQRVRDNWSNWGCMHTHYKICASRDKYSMCVVWILRFYGLTWSDLELSARIFQSRFLSRVPSNVGSLASDRREKAFLGSASAKTVKVRMFGALKQMIMADWNDRSERDEAVKIT